MKRLVSIKTLVIAVATNWVVSCQLVEIQNDEGSTADPTAVIQGPSQIPADQETIAFYLHKGNTKSWKAQGFTTAGISGFQECRLDDVIILKADGTFEYDGGDFLCGAEDDQRLKSGIWEINLSEGVLIFNKGGQLEYRAVLVGLEQNAVVLAGSYFGLEIKGVYTSG